METFDSLAGQEIKEPTLPAQMSPPFLNVAARRDTSL